MNTDEPKPKTGRPPLVDWPAVFADPRVDEQTDKQIAARIGTSEAAVTYNRRKLGLKKDHRVWTHEQRNRHSAKFLAKKQTKARRCPCGKKATLRFQGKPICDSCLNAETDLEQCRAEHYSRISLKSSAGWF